MNFAHITYIVRQASPGSIDLHFDSPTTSNAPLVLQYGSTKTNYYNFNVLSQGSKKLAIRQSVYVHGSPTNNLKDYNALMNGFKVKRHLSWGCHTSY